MKKKPQFAETFARQENTLGAAWKVMKRYNTPQPRRHKCEFCGRIFECESCTEMMHKFDQTFLYSKEHANIWNVPARWICPNCTKGEKRRDYPICHCGSNTRFDIKCQKHQ